MIGRLILLLIAIALIIVCPIITIWIMNFLLCQMFASYIPLQVTVYNWLAIVGLEILFVGGSRSSSN